jgi:hypothetical protein
MSTITDWRSPFAGILTWILSVGYNLLSSVLELTDNSLSKTSSTLRVILFKDTVNSVKLLSRIIIMDDGSGMDFQNLCESFIIANVKEGRDDEDIGKFGIGMKSAIMNMGTHIIILTRAVGGNIVGLFADVDQMKLLNSPSPTELCDNVTSEWALKYISQQSWDEFNSQESGTLIQVKNLRQKCQVVYDRARETIIQTISTSYSRMPNQCVLQIEDGDMPLASPLRTHVVVPNDLFYHDRRECLDEDPCEITLHIYAGEPGCPNSVIEENRSKRPITHNKFTVGTSAKPAYYRYTTLKARDQYNSNMSKIDSLPNRPLLGSIKLRLIQTSEVQYKEESKFFSETDQLNSDRKGFWFNRGIRSVGFAKKLGKKLHDRTTMAAERQRMLVTFPASLDDEVGSKFNKQMEDKELPSQILTDCLYSIYRQITNRWVDADQARIEERKRVDEKKRLDEQKVSNVAQFQQGIAEYLLRPQTVAPVLEATLTSASDESEGELIPGIIQSASEESEGEVSVVASEESEGEVAPALTTQDLAYESEGEVSELLVQEVTQEVTEVDAQVDAPALVDEEAEESQLENMQIAPLLNFMENGESVCVIENGLHLLKIPSFGNAVSLMDWLKGVPREFIMKTFA